MYRSIFYILLLSLSIGQINNCLAQQNNADFDDSFRNNNLARVLFWNVENLFDTFNDSLTNDDAFTPSGNNHWNHYRYRHKLKNIAQTLTAAGGWSPVEIVCLAEVENRRVLVDLVNETILKSHNYDIIHKNSPDFRGIDVAILYNPQKFKVDTFNFIRVNFPDNSRTTRDILYVSGFLQKRKIHLFVNHWPSRFGGHMATEPKRIFTANLLRSKVDSIYDVEPNANIIITGDFNDEPEDKSLKLSLGCTNDTSSMTTRGLHNLMEAKTGREGTHKFQGRWGILDQIIISTPLLKKRSGLSVIKNEAVIFKAPFLLEKDVTHLGTKLFRTYIGPKYNGGYSDHLPIYLDLQSVDNKQRKSR